MVSGRSYGEMLPSVDQDRPAEGELAGKVALVTGGTRGIGRVIAARLAQAGASVLACGRSQPESQPEPQPAPQSDRQPAPQSEPQPKSRREPESPPEPRPAGVEFAAADVRDPEQASGLVQDAVRRFGRLDIVVNNAGGSPSAPAASASPNLITAVVRLNLLAPFFVAQAANAVMQAQPQGGLILNIGSVSAFRPAPGTAAYAAAKAGLVTLTQALAIEWAPAVRVNCITAGLVRTDDSATHYGGEQALAAVAATVPLGRMATPDDIADACLLLASPLAAYLTGANLVVDGGGQRPAFFEATRFETTRFEETRPGAE